MFRPTGRYVTDVLTFPLYAEQYDYFTENPWSETIANALELLQSCAKQNGAVIVCALLLKLRHVAL